MNEKMFWSLMRMIVLVYLSGVVINIMDIDAGQYASISREMLESGSYLQVYEQGKDYLDKPPLLFWLSSQSMRLFGANNFGYKLPSILFALLAIFSTYRFALVFYNKTIALLSALILASTQAMALITHDCRTDTILMGCIAFTFWQLAAAFHTQKWQHFLLGFIGVGMGMLAKGPVALIIPILGFTGHFIWKKEYKNFLRLEYLWGVLVIGLVLLPMSYGLYQQFDMHPEKIINGKTGTSGLQFFYWVQSFGRITGENTWRNDAYFGYLFEAMLWSFFPWVLFLIGGIIHAILSIFKLSQLIENQELISLSTCILGYISLASSKYQLPHYIFVIYPMAAVVASYFLYNLLFEKKDISLEKIITGLQWFFIVLVWALPFLITLYVFPTSIIPLSIMAFFFLLFLYQAFRQKSVIISSISTFISINLYLNLSFYPNLLTYQAGSEVGRYIHEQGIPIEKFATFQYEPSSSLHFYTKKIVENKQDVKSINIGDWLLTDETGLQVLTEGGIEYDMKETGNTFPVTTLTPKFLDFTTRDQVTGQYFLVFINNIFEVEEE